MFLKCPHHAQRVGGRLAGLLEVFSAARRRAEEARAWACC